MNILIGIICITAIVSVIAISIVKAGKDEDRRSRKADRDIIIVCAECGEEVTENINGLTVCPSCRTIEGKTKEITIKEYEK